MARRLIWAVVLRCSFLLGLVAWSCSYGLSELAAFVPSARPGHALEEDVSRSASAEASPTGFLRLPPSSSAPSDALQDLEQGIRRTVAIFLAFAVGCVFSFGSAYADAGAEEAAVEAAWGFVQRNYYDQSFYGQDWDKAHQRFLDRVRRGESAKTVTRDMVSSLQDKYSRIIDSETFEKMMAYDPLGVGVVLARDEAKNVLVSSPPFANSAGAKAGIQQGDFVDSIDGISLSKEPMLAVMDRIARADAAQVTMALRREGSAPKTWEASLTRVRTTPQENAVISGVTPASSSSGAHQVGYLRLRNFGSRSAIDLAAAIDQVRKGGADELVLDLRGNPGGSFQAALEVASLFLDPGSIANRVTASSGGASASTAKRDRPLRIVGSNGATAAPVREPLALLVDEGSASASEVLASSLRGNCRAPLLGSKTFGKAAVQGVFGLPNAEAIALTVAKYSGPDGRTIDGGIQPDGPGPQGPLARLAGAAGLPMKLSEQDYGRVDFGPSSVWDALRECRVPVENLESPKTN